MYYERQLTHTSTQKAGMHADWNYVSDNTANTVLRVLEEFCCQTKVRYIDICY